MGNEIIKNITTEAASIATEIGFTAILSAAGYPTLKIALPFVKGTALGLIEKY